MLPSDLERHVRALLEPVLGRLGYDLVSVEWAGSVLRLAIDGPNGVGVGDVVRVSHQVSPLLDADDPIPGSYRLEVTSPGIDRPVQRLADFERFVGYRVKIRLVEGFPRRRYSGRLMAVNGEDIVVEVDGAQHTLSYGSIERANLVLDLDEYQRLAQPASPDAKESHHDHE